MANKRDKNVEYDEYKVKVPRRDKDGNDISGDKLGGGGRHREDGTISAMAYDFQPLDDSSFDREEAEIRLQQYEYETRLAEQREAEARQEAIEAGIELVDDVFNFLAEHPEVVVAIGKGIKKGALFVGDKAKSAFSWIRSIGKNKAKQIAVKKNTLPSNDALFDEDIEGETMTLKEAQAEYIELFKDFLRMKSRAQKLARANIVDADVETVDANQFIELMNSLSNKYPSLLDEGVQATVFEMLNSVKNEREKAAILEELNIS